MEPQQEALAQTQLHLEQQNPRELADLALQQVQLQVSVDLEQIQALLRQVLVVEVLVPQLRRRRRQVLDLEIQLVLLRVLDLVPEIQPVQLRVFHLAARERRPQILHLALLLEALPILVLEALAHQQLHHLVLSKLVFCLISVQFCPFLDNIWSSFNFTLLFFKGGGGGLFGGGGGTTSNLFGGTQPNNFGGAQQNFMQNQAQQAPNVNEQLLNSIMRVSLFGDDRDNLLGNLKFPAFF